MDRTGDYSPPIALWLRFWVRCILGLAMLSAGGLFTITVIEGLGALWAPKSLSLQWQIALPAILVLDLANMFVPAIVPAVWKDRQYSPPVWLGVLASIPALWLLNWLPGVILGPLG